MIMIFYVNDVDGKSDVTTKNIDSQMVVFFMVMENPMVKRYLKQAQVRVQGTQNPKSSQE